MTRGEQDFQEEVREGVFSVCAPKKDEGELG